MRQQNPTFMIINKNFKSRTTAAGLCQGRQRLNRVWFGPGLLKSLYGDLLEFHFSKAEITWVVQPAEERTQGRLLRSWSSS